MPLTHTYTFSPGAVIFASRFNTNFGETATWANAHEAATTGVHGVGAGSIMGTQNNNVMAGSGYVSGGSIANGLRVGSLDPTASGGLGYANSLFKISDGSLAHLIMMAPWLSEGIYNASITYSAGVFKIVGADGNDWSTSNPGILRIRNTSSGAIETLLLTTSPSFNDDAHASSDITGEEVGVTSGVAWGEDRPWFIGFYNSDNTVSGVNAFISPKPNWTETPSSGANIGYKGNPMSSPSDSGIFVLTSTDPTSDTSVPAVMCGAFRMQMSSSDDWTVQTLSNADGIGRFHEETTFNMVKGQMGSDSGKWGTIAGGGTFPTYTDTDKDNITYRIKRSGNVEVVVYLNNTSGGVGGTGGTMEISLPYALLNGYPRTPFGRCFESGGRNDIHVIEANTAGTKFIILITGNGALLKGTDQNTSPYACNGVFEYRAF